MAKNYYDILGLDPDATPEQIKSAYRRKVKEFHPDHFGEDCAPFLTVREAYDVLSDPDRRQAYDARLARKGSGQQRSPTGFPVQPSYSARSPVEPLIPHQEPGNLRETAFNPSPFENLFYTRDHPPHHSFARDEAIEVEIPLTPAQVRRGGRIQLALPVESRCPACRGYGITGPYICRRCFGEGRLLKEYPLLLSFPPGINPPQTVDVSLDRFGLSDIYLRVHFVTRAFF